MKKILFFVFLVPLSLLLINFFKGHKDDFFSIEYIANTSKKTTSDVKNSVFLHESPLRKKRSKQISSVLINDYHSFNNYLDKDVLKNRIIGQILSDKENIEIMVNEITDTQLVIRKYSKIQAKARILFIDVLGSYCLQEDHCEPLLRSLKDLQKNMITLGKNIKGNNYDLIDLLTYYFKYVGVKDFYQRVDEILGGINYEPYFKQIYAVAISYAFPKDYNKKYFVDKVFKILLGD